MAERDPASTPVMVVNDEVPRRRRWPWIAAALIVCLAAGGAWTWQRSHAGAAATTAATKSGNSGRGGAGGNAKRTIPVQAVPVTKGDLHVYFSALGTVTSPNSVIVRPRVDGQLMRMAVKEGDIIKAGQLIAEIDPRPFQVQLEQAQGQLARDNAQLQNAQLNLVRYKTLLEQESIAPQQVETQEALVRQYQGTIKADQAAVDSARLQLTYSKVVAPVGGRLGLRVVDPGNVVRASDTTGIITVNQVQPINVLFTLPETQLPTVMKPLLSGARLPVQAWDREQKNMLAEGRVASFDNQIDTTTGTVKLKAQFPNADFGLFPNQFVNVKLLAETRKDVTLAPSAAVQRGRDGAFVYLVQPDSTVTLRRVTLGPVENDRVAIEKGLAPGDVVVTDGIDQLREGVKVEVADATALLTPKARKGRRQHDAGNASAPAAADPAANDGKAARARPADAEPRKPAAADANVTQGDAPPPAEARKGGWARKDDGTPPSDEQRAKWRAEHGAASAPQASATR